MLKQRDSDYSSDYQLTQQTVNGERIQYHSRQQKANLGNDEIGIMD
jgi:hypothetical protein